jgi:hypothetical protein
MTGGVDLRQLSRWLILLLLLVGTAFLLGPAHAQSISITLQYTTINTPMGSVFTDGVTLINNDPVNSYDVDVRVAKGAWGYPSSVTVHLDPSATESTQLTFAVPGPESICPGEISPGPYYGTYTVEVTDHHTHALYASASLTVNVLPVVFPVTITMEPSKPSYRVGEPVTLTMSSNVPSPRYSLKVTQPDGSTWATAQGQLPATFTKPAAEPLGTYTAELLAYYCGMWQDSATFSVTPNTYDVTISLAGLPTNVATALRVDGNKITDMKGGDVRVLSYPIDTSHTFAVDQYVNGTTGYRYYSASNSWTASSEGSNTFNYAAQVYLDVSTDPQGITDVTPAGWYAAGSSASIAQVPTEVKGTEGTKYVFKEWTVDGSSKTSNGFALLMDGPHKVIAKYDTMFLLTVASDYGNPQGQGYYKAGKTATFSVDSPVGMGIQQVFVEWKGDYTGKDAHGSITMDAPKQVTAVWTTSYIQLLMIAGVILAILVIAALLLWRRRSTRPASVKPPPTPPPGSTETPAAPAETPPTPELETTSKPSVSVALRCTNCGHELNEGQIYCPECGQKQAD